MAGKNNCGGGVQKKCAHIGGRGHKVYRDAYASIGPCRVKSIYPFGTVLGKDCDAVAFTYPVKARVYADLSQQLVVANG
jgi:hypothetical protein